MAKPTLEQALTAVEENLTLAYVSLAHLDITNISKKYPVPESAGQSFLLLTENVPFVHLILSINRVLDKNALGVQKLLSMFITNMDALSFCPQDSTERDERKNLLGIAAAKCTDSYLLPELRRWRDKRLAHTDFVVDFYNFDSKLTRVSIELLLNDCLSFTNLCRSLLDNSELIIWPHYERILQAGIYLLSGRVIAAKESVVPTPELMERRRAVSMLMTQIRDEINGQRPLNRSQ